MSGEFDDILPPVPDEPEKPKVPKARHPRISLHIKRIDGTIRLLDSGPPDDSAQAEAIQIRTMLNDFSYGGVGFFVPQELKTGQRVEFTVHYLRAFTAVGKVIWCLRLPQQHAPISTFSGAFRVGLQFVFTKPDEVTNVKTFCDELQREIK